MQTDDLAAQMVRSIHAAGIIFRHQMIDVEAIARRYIEKALFDQRAKVELEHLAELEKLQCEINSQAEEIERLNERLENNHVYDSDGNRVDVEPGSIPDGIACRDETIILQDRKIQELRAALKAAQEVGRDA